MIDSKEVQRKLLESIRKRGPSLPVQLSRDVGVNSLFVAAFLSELAGDKQIKISSLKVGGSPLYFIPGQEQLLEKSYTYLGSKEAEAFLLLQKNRILNEIELEPAIRVAIKSLRDFAFQFKRNDLNYWRFHSVSSQEIEDFFNKSSRPTQPEKIQEPIIENKPAEPIKDIQEEKPIEKLTDKPVEQIIIERPTEPIEKPAVKPTEKEIQIETKQEEKKVLEIKIEGKTETTKEEAKEETREIIILPSQKQIESIQKEEEKPIKEIIKIIEKPVVVEKQVFIEKPIYIEKQSDVNEFQNPLASKPEPIAKKDKPKSDYVLNLIKFLEKCNFKILEEKEHKTKEYTAIVQINSDLGPIAFLTFARDKKSVSDVDLKKFLSDAQTIPLPALVIHSGSLNKKAQEYAEKYYSILKVKKFEI